MDRIYGGEGMGRGLLTADKTGWPQIRWMVLETRARDRGGWGMGRGLVLDKMT